MKCAYAALLSAVAFFIPAAAVQEMTWEQYTAELNSVMQREKTAREEIAREQSQIENLKQQAGQVDLQIAAVIQETYRLLGITEQDVIDAEAALANFSGIFSQYLALPAAELPKRKQDVKQHEAQFLALKAKRVCLLSRVAQRVGDVEAILSQVKFQLAGSPTPAAPVVQEPPSRYTVGRSGGARNLWKIAEEVYGDHCQWPRIYRSNKRKIDRIFNRYKDSPAAGAVDRPQDFVLPGWTLDIPR